MTPQDRWTTPRQRATRGTIIGPTTATERRLLQAFAWLDWGPGEVSRISLVDSRLYGPVERQGLGRALFQSKPQA